MKYDHFITTRKDELNMLAKYYSTKILEDGKIEMTQEIIDKINLVGIEKVLAYYKEGIVVFEFEDNKCVFCDGDDLEADLNGVFVCTSCIDRLTQISKLDTMEELEGRVKYITSNSEHNNREFKDILKMLRKKEKLTQGQLAEKLNFGFAAICNFESGRNEPSLNDLIKLSHIFDVSVDYLIGNN